MIEISISPVAFDIGRPIYWVNIIFPLAGIVLLLWVVRQRKRIAGLSLNLVLNEAIVGLFSGLVISKLFHVISMWDYYIENPGQILVFSGRTMWGYVMGVTLGVAIYSKVKNIPVRQFLDLAAPGAILAQAIFRVSCTMNGCCYGIPTSLPWGVVYTHPHSVAYIASLNLPPGMGLHPTQIYEIAYCLIVFAVLLKIRGRLQPEGSLILLYFILYAAWRLGIDFLREGTPFVADLHQAQFLSIVVLVIAIPLLVYNKRRLRL